MGSKFRRVAVTLTLLVMTLAAGRGLADEPKKTEPSRHPPAIPPGEKTKVSVFGIDGEGNKIVYVFDRSSSMGTGQNALATVKTEIVRSFQAVDSVHQFQIISYNERPRIFSPTGQPGRLIFGTDENKTAAEDYVNWSRPTAGPITRPRSCWQSRCAGRDLLVHRRRRSEAEPRSNWNGSTASGAGPSSTRSRSAKGRSPRRKPSWRSSPSKAAANTSTSTTPRPRPTRSGRPTRMRPPINRLPWRRTWPLTKTPPRTRSRPPIRRPRTDRAAAGGTADRVEFAGIRGRKGCPATEAGCGSLVSEGQENPPKSKQFSAPIDLLGLAIPFFQSKIDSIILELTTISLE